MSENHSEHTEDAEVSWETSASSALSAGGTASWAHAPEGPEKQTRQRLCLRRAWGLGDDHQQVSTLYLGNPGYGEAGDGAAHRRRN